MGKINREVGEGKDTHVVCHDLPGAGNACHEYEVVPVNQKISFQNGPIQEKGINGIQNEDLLAIVIDRLVGFQSGNFNCRENAIALTNIRYALLWLHQRTADRTKRRVEGKTIK